MTPNQLHDALSPRGHGTKERVEVRHFSIYTTPKNRMMLIDIVQKVLG